MQRNHQIFFVLFLAALLGACAGLGLEKADKASEHMQYVRGNLNTVYDTVVVLRKGCLVQPPAPTCKMTDVEKGKVLAIANSAGEIITLIESGTSTTTACLAILNKGLATAGQPPVVTALSCIDLVTTVINSLRASLS